MIDSMSEDWQSIPGEVEVVLESVHEWYFGHAAKGLEWLRSLSHETWVFALATQVTDADATGVHDIIWVAAQWVVRDRTAPDSTAKDRLFRVLDDEWPGCAYMTDPGQGPSLSNDGGDPPSYCDDVAVPGSEYCTEHKRVADYDPAWEDID